jgi:AcrR family transcriptional regulator
LEIEANVNLAAPNYYFRSKEGLFRAVFERRVIYEPGRPFADDVMAARKQPACGQRHPGVPGACNRISASGS